MAGGRLILRGTAVAVALLAFTGGAVAATLPIPAGIWSFELKGTQGYFLGVHATPAPASSHGEVEIFVGDGRGRVTYVAPATVSESALEADLGSLGRISLRAEPTGVERTFQPSCEKQRFRYEAVEYVGEFAFHGEEDYTDASATKLPLLVKPILEASCVWFGEGHLGGDGITGAGLHIGSRGHRPRLRVSARTNGPGKAVETFASIREQRGEIAIERSVGRRFPHSVFTYDPHLARATLQPPSPFSGRGVFRRSAPDANRWTGNLRVDFPGRSNVPVTGGRFRPVLQHGEWQSEVIHETPRLLGRTLPKWPSTKPSPTAFATSLPLGPS